MAFLRRRPSTIRGQPVTAAQQLVASGRRVSDPDPDRETVYMRRAEEWQHRIWEYMEEIPEVRYAARYMGDAFARLTLFVGIRPEAFSDPVPLDPAGDADLNYTTAEARAAQEVLARLTSPMGGQAEIQRRIGVQLSLPGECYLVGQPVGDGPEERWDVYSIEEIVEAKDERQQNSAGEDVSTFYLAKPGSTTRDKKLSADTVVLRIWRPHPRYSEWADSPMRSAVGILDELLILTKSIAAGALSRVSGGGMLFLPESMRTAPKNGARDDEPDKTVTDMIAIAAKAISDPASPAARLPTFHWINDDLWKEMGQDKLVQFGKDIDAVAGEQRAEIIRRFAAAIDLPAEVLTGMGDVKFWNLQYIGEEGFRAHIEPAVILMDSALTETYLHPALDGGGIEDVGRFVIWHDATMLTSKPNEAENAQRAYDAAAIKAESYRKALGFSEDDAPEPDELAERIRVDQARKGAVALAPGVDGARPAEPPAQAAIVASSTDHFRGLVERLAEMDRTLLMFTQHLADSATHRVLERANARLRSLAQRDATARPILAQVPASSLMVAQTLGPALVQRLAGEEDLLAGAFDAIRDRYLARVARVGDETLLLAQKYGADAVTAALSDAEADQLRGELERERDASWDVLHVALLTAAGVLLFRPAPEGPPGEVDGALVPAGVVRGALARAGGGGERAVSMLTGDLVERVWAQSGVIFGGFMWQYGDASIRVQTFQPHRRLDGLVFASPNDDRLGNTSGYPHVSHFWPGDHRGCLCTVARTAPALRPAPVIPTLSGRN